MREDGFRQNREPKMRRLAVAFCVLEEFPVDYGAERSPKEVMPNESADASMELRLRTVPTG